MDNQRSENQRECHVTLQKLSFVWPHGVNEVGVLKNLHFDQSDWNLYVKGERKVKPIKNMFMGSKLYDKVGGI